MKVLVTGANGFIGSHLTAALVNKGYDVRCLVRKTSNLELLEKFTDPRSLKLCYGDISDPASLDEHMRDIDVVYHLAGAIKAFTQEDFDRVNFYGTKNVLDALLRVNPAVKKVVFVSSMAANGPSAPDRAALEEDEPHPIDAYGISKCKAEKMVKENYMGIIPVTIIRPPSVFGPGDRVSFDLFRQVSKGIKLYPKGPDRYYSIAHVSDLVDGIILSGERKEATGEIFYICGDGAETWQGLQDIIAEALGKKIRLTLRISKPTLMTVAYFAELVGKIRGTVPFINREKVKEALAPAWTCSNEKAKKLLGFSPKLSIEEGLKIAARWYRENGWLK